MSASTAAIAPAVIARSGWGNRVRLIQPHNPAFWLYWMLVINGAYVYYTMLRHYSVYATATTLGIILFVVYALPFVWFINRADRYETEPAKLTILAFLWGGLAAPWMMALPGNGANLSLYSKLISPEFASSWGPPLTAPFVEESAKYCGLILIYLMARSHVRSAYDGMILGAFIGLGFQVFENYLYVVQASDSSFGTNQVSQTIQIFVMRGLSGLWTHALYTAIAGAGFGYFVGNPHKSLGRRLFVAIAFYIAATLIHSTLDAAAATPLAVPISITAATIGIIIAWRFADRRQRDWVQHLLAGDVERGTVTQSELDVLAGPRKARTRFLKSIRNTDGKAASQRVEHVLDAENDLAAAIAATNDPDGAEATAARAEVARVRAMPVA